MFYPSKKDVWISLIIWSTVLIMVVSIAISPAEIWWGSFILGIAVTGLMLWILYGTYYEFRDEYLYARSGPFTERIKYDMVIEAALCNNLYSSMALSRERVFIRTTRKALASVTYVSPINREDFLADLRSRCRNIK
ncbi:MAG: PH domain-containing protein [bacterium]|nr:PH domain-containing protein [bacterium]